MGHGELGMIVYLRTWRDVPVLRDIHLPYPTEHRVPLNPRSVPLRVGERVGRKPAVRPRVDAHGGAVQARP